MSNQYLRFGKYILKHKYYTLIKCISYGIPLRGILHDIDKLWPSTFKYYANGNKPGLRDSNGHYYASGVKGVYAIALNEHLKKSKHHWQHWTVVDSIDGVIQVSALEIPHKYVLEMAADMYGAGMAQGKPNILGYYIANKNNIILHPESRKELEKLLGYHDN